MARAATESSPLGAAGALGWARDHGVYVAFAALVLFNVVFTTNFATTATLFNLLIQVAPVLIVALGMALVIGTEGVDLSVGAVMALAAAVIPLYLGAGPLVAIVLALVVAGLTNRTTFGRQLVAIGGNRKAATLAGLPVSRVLIGVYAITGVLAAIAGVLATSRLAASDPAD